MALAEIFHPNNSDAEELADTQTPSTCTFLDSQEIQTPKQAWGKLYPTIIRLKTVDLIERQFFLGRSKECDVSLTSDNFNPNCLKTISKTHFLITHDENDETVYITDLSKNGTFINETQIGRGKKTILQNDDEIAVGGKKVKVYIYKPVGKSEDTYLPTELRREYEVSKKLGEGGCGEVRLLFRKNDCKEFAVKRILKSKTESGKSLNSLTRIHNEIAILKTVSHPNILSTIKTAETDEAVFMVLEYMNGGSLQERIRFSEKLPERIAKLIFYQILIGVQYLHLRGITHRDLKPENILLKTDNEETLVKIADFGLSKLIVNSTVMTTTCGTPNFLAPEIIDNRYQKYTQEVDIWSLGVILFYMLSGQLPFQSDSLHYLFRLILSGEYSMDETLWCLISNDAKDLVKHMLVVDPEKRIKISDILSHPWITNDSSIKRNAEDLINLHVDKDDPPNEDGLPEAKRARLD
ncbi:hypothetical protein ILUMI_09593 [Ignelater luminosus]|uniref:Serine/threonine-protein kinase Chk2 n=1 Tax=Ignelater luminosus TaxID=2038154 RepID=A0A8K0GEX0_IGNLU|nr:hypothetical protein ILUMI_09593 [Ignelater luminosus]